MTEAPHVPPETMKKWREAIRKGDNSALDLLIEDLVKPVKDMAITSLQTIRREDGS